MNYSSQLIGTGSFMPETVLDNQFFESFLETSDEWITTRTGIKERRKADPDRGQGTIDSAYQASLRALEDAQMSAETIDLIIVGTVTPDILMPSTANYLQAKLGTTQAFGFDISAACSGFLYAWSTADQFIRSGQCENVLIVGVETLSRFINWRDRSTAVLFGDGAGAAVLKRNDDSTKKKNTWSLHSDGRHTDLLCVPHGGAKVPPNHRDYKVNKCTIHMTGKEVFKLAVRGMGDAITKVLKHEKMAPAEVDFFIFHQANMRILEVCMKTLNIPEEKTWINIDKYGNTSSATVAVCLDEARKAGKIKEGQSIVISTFGGGLTWGAGVIHL